MTRNPGCPWERSAHNRTARRQKPGTLYTIAGLSVTSMRSINRTLSRFLIAIAAALCLLGAQHGAVLHELSHFAQIATSAQDSGSAEDARQLAQDRQDKQDEQPHSRSCDKCAHYAELGGGALPVSAWRISIEDAASASASAPQQFSPSLTVAAYAARAPPALL